MSIGLHNHGKVINRFKFNKYKSQYNKIICFKMYLWLMNLFCLRAKLLFLCKISLFSNLSLNIYRLHWNNKRRSRRDVFVLSVIKKLMKQIRLEKRVKLMDCPNHRLLNHLQNQMIKLKRFKSKQILLRFILKILMKLMYHTIKSMTILLILTWIKPYYQNKNLNKN